VSMAVSESVVCVFFLGVRFSVSVKIRVDFLDWY